MVRNPYFRSWSPQDRPPASPDRIQVSARRFGKGARGRAQVAEQVTEIRRGPPT